MIDPRQADVDHYDIISYTWGPAIPKPYWKCHDILGLDWDLNIRPEKLEEIKRFMVFAQVQYMWVDCVCIKQCEQPETEKLGEMPRMYDYYKAAQRCHILMNMDQVWDPQTIVNDLRFLDHVLEAMPGQAVAAEANVTQRVRDDLVKWANDQEKPWTFPLPVTRRTAQSAGIELGVLNCYSTCISHVKQLFENKYFTRVWTFQEMLLGKNATMYGINDHNIFYLGELDDWMDLATNSKDKAYKLFDWIDRCRVLNNASVNAILGQIAEDKSTLDFLQTQVMGISSARTDILNGGPRWWHQNHKGISNVFSAISIKPRTCSSSPDIFKGLLGVFNGLFTNEEVAGKLGGEDIEKISFAFFKQLSLKTDQAWTKLAISRGEREKWDWIPVVKSHDKLMTTDCFAGVINLGHLRQKTEASASTGALTGIDKTPHKCMRIEICEIDTSDYDDFVYKGCNCGKNITTGFFSSDPIPIYDTPITVAKDEIGRTLVQCATILGSIIDPGGNVVDFRRRFLHKLQPYWRTTDPSARPAGWVDRCVSGTPWEQPLLRAHNMSMHFRMKDVSCGSRLDNPSTHNMVCKVTVKCGCTFTAPFSWTFEAITSMYGSSLGDTTMALDGDNRIILQDGMGLVQVGDVGKVFNLVAFGGEVRWYREHAIKCRKTREEKEFSMQSVIPFSRALVPESFKHGAMDMMRNYGYVPTGGSGNLLICRDMPLKQYKIIGVCIDESIPTKKGQHPVYVK
ncbi:hypothetical protein E6O75_ATG06046 [Venturia nashicola]|uniref:Heterokaryon incompatibility domain-containing protein n=1 Tax=Venturia nashicola TaxID=86259 RepID=A0A4Z1P411_9PEZI|nr:hypothetical protein E6O75_ATG06046 [Venturia nashicola]